MTGFTINRIRFFRIGIFIPDMYNESLVYLFGTSLRMVAEV